MSIAGVNESDVAKSVADISNELVVASAKESVVPDPAMLVGIVDESIPESVVASAKESVVPDPAMLAAIVDESVNVSVVASANESVVPDPAMLVAMVNESVVATSVSIPNESVVAGADEPVVPAPPLSAGIVDVDESGVASAKESVVPDPAMLVAIVDESIPTGWFLAGADEPVVPAPPLSDGIVDESDVAYVDPLVELTQSPHSSVSIYPPVVRTTEPPPILIPKHWRSSVRKHRLTNGLCIIPGCNNTKKLVYHQMNKWLSLTE